MRAAPRIWLGRFRNGDTSITRYRGDAPVANSATNEGQGAKRAGRLVSRALLVLAGAVAGTAAAWLVSGATASADTASSNPAPGNTVEVGAAPIAEAATGSVGDVND